MVGVMAAAVIVLLLVIVFFYGGFGNQGSTKVLGGEKLTPRADNNGLTVPGMVRYKALDDVCRNNLSQIRSSMAVGAATSPDEPHPASLADLHLPAEMLYCPIQPHEPYNYDPATGKVRCLHPGHGKY